MRSEARDILGTVGKVVAILAGLTTLWQFGVHQGWIPGKSPTEIIQSIVSPGTTASPSPPSPTIPTLPSPPHLAVPTNVTVDGGCDGPIVSWQPVDGADGYRVEEDGHFAGTTHDTSYQVHVFPDNKQHSYRVRATALGARSDASTAVIVGPCSF